MVVESKKPNKQRKFRKTASLHIKQKMLKAHLSKELKEKYKKRSIGLKKGDKVKIMRGKYADKEGTITKVDLKGGYINVDKIYVSTKSGKELSVKIDPSNVMVLELVLDDDKRIKILKR